MHASIYYRHQNVFTKRNEKNGMKGNTSWLVSQSKQTWTLCHVNIKQHKAQGNYLFRSIFKGYKGDLLLWIRLGIFSRKRKRSFDNLKITRRVINETVRKEKVHLHFSQLIYFQKYKMGHGSHLGTSLFLYNNILLCFKGL